MKKIKVWHILLIGIFIGLISGYYCAYNVIQRKSYISCENCTWEEITGEYNFLND